MKFLYLLVCGILLAPSTAWLYNMEDAKKTAAQKHELIILNFSGSDWCGPCIRLRKEIFESTDFKTYADENLVLVNADFPRLKKNQPSKEQIKINEALADQYNPKGKFPYTLLLSADGKILKTWDGFPGVSAEDFTNEIKTISNATVK